MNGMGRLKEQSGDCGVGLTRHLFNELDFVVILGGLIRGPNRLGYDV